MNNSILSYSYASNEIKGYNLSEIAKNEKNDCFVRAVAAATGSNYDAAHSFVKEKFGRKNGKGTELVQAHMMNLEKNGMEIDGKEFKVSVLGSEKTTNKYKLYGEIVKRKKTVKSFIKDNPKGTFIVGVSKHAFTVKDGVLIDNAGEEFRPTRKVDCAFKIDGKEEVTQLSLF